MCSWIHTTKEERKVWHLVFFHCTNRWDGSTLSTRTLSINQPVCSSGPISPASYFDHYPLLISSRPPSCPALLICLLPLASSILPPSSTLPPLPPPQGFSGYHTSLVQTSWGFFRRANYRQLGAQRITFSVQGKAEARGQRAVLWNTQIRNKRREKCVCVCGCVCVVLGPCSHL